MKLANLNDSDNEQLIYNATGNDHEHDNHNDNDNLPNFARQKEHKYRAPEKEKTRERKREIPKGSNVVPFWAVYYNP